MALEKGTYVFRNAQGSLALSADPAKANQNGCALVLLEYTGANTQHWVIEPIAGETDRYFIRSAANTSFGIDADGGNENKNGCKVQLWSSHTGDNQKWHIRGKSVERYYIIESSTHLMITPEADEPNSKHQLWSFINNVNQKWAISKV